MKSRHQVTMILQSIFTARRLGFAYKFWRARGWAPEHVKGVK